MRNISIDLETLGILPGAAIASIGMAEFDSSGVIDSVQINVSLTSCQAAGLNVTADTVVWWFMQSEEARRNLFNPKPVLLETALRKVSKIVDQDSTLVWGNGASFDLGILAAAYRAVDQDKPWHFRHERDVRTAKDLGKRMGLKLPERPTEGHHTAIVDAEYQAEIVAAVFRQCNVRN